MWSIPRTLSKFWVLEHFKLSYLLDSKKYGFWVDFGSQVGPKNRSCWLQDGKMTVRYIFLAIKIHKKTRKKSDRATPVDCSSLGARDPLGGPHDRPFNPIKTDITWISL